MSDRDDLSEKIAHAKQRLSLPELMTKLGLGEHARKRARCPFHSPDSDPSFSVFHSTTGKGWQWKCHAGCGGGDEIDFLCQARGISTKEAVTLYLDMARFPAESPECSEHAA